MISPLPSSTKSSLETHPKSSNTKTINQHTLKDKAFIRKENKTIQLTNTQTIKETLHQSRETFIVLCFSQHKNKYLTLSSYRGIDFSL